MKKELAEAIHRLGGDAGDPIWQWFVHNGPHGQRFTWHQTRKEPPGYVGVEHLERIVSEREETNPLFRTQAKTVVQKALSSDNLDLLRRAIQIAAVVGDEAELQRVSELAKHENEQVAADARASGFYLKKRLGAKASAKRR